MNEPKRALHELETALQYARVRRDPKVECEVLMSLCDLLDREGDHNRLMELAGQSLELARAARNTRNVILSLRRIGWEHVRAGRPEEGRAALEEAVQVAVESQKIEQLTLAMDSLGAFYYLRGNYGLAVRGYEDLLGQLRRTIRSRGPAAQTL
jgi:tetratricopeptide (TPR) repeat protein